MDNHLHLVAVPENEHSLAKGVGLTNQVYTQYLNRKLNQSGRIWQNRFFSCIVENNQYLWAVARYVECNPVKAGLVHSAEEYRWSSAKVHLSGANSPLLHKPAWLDPTEQKAYVDYVKNSDTEIENAINNGNKNWSSFWNRNFH